MRSRRSGRRAERKCDAETEEERSGNVMRRLRKSGAET